MVGASLPERSRRRRRRPSIAAVVVLGTSTALGAWLTIAVQNARNAARSSSTL